VIPSCKVQQADKENEEMVKLTIGEDPARPVMIGLIRLMSKLIRQRKAVTVMKNAPAQQRMQGLGTFVYFYDRASAWMMSARTWTPS